MENSLNNQLEEDNFNFWRYIGMMFAVAATILAVWLNIAWLEFDRHNVRIALLAIGVALLAIALIIRVFWAWIKVVATCFCGVLCFVSAVLWLDYRGGNHSFEVLGSAIVGSFLALEALLWAVRGSPPDQDDILQIEADWSEAKDPTARLRRVMIRTNSNRSELDEFTHAELRDHAHVLALWVVAAVFVTGACTILHERTDIPSRVLILIWIVLGAAPLLLRWVYWLKNTNAFTDKRIIQVYGFIGKDFPQATIRQINDVKLHIPWYSDVMTWLRWTYTQFGSLQLEIPGNVVLNNIDNIPQIYGVNRRVAAMIIRR